MVSIHGPLGYEPNTLATAPVRYVCKLHLAAAAKEQGLWYDVAPYLVETKPQDQQAAPSSRGKGTPRQARCLTRPGCQSAMTRPLREAEAPE